MCQPPTEHRRRAAGVVAALCLWLAIGQPLWAGPAGFTPPPPAHWEYTVSGQARGIPYRASARLHWEHDSLTYRARTEVTAFLVGSRVQTSSGTLGPDGPRPEVFTDQARKQRQIRFDRLRGTIDFTHGDGSQTSEAPYAAGVQDRLSLFLYLGGRLAASGPPPSGTAWQVPVTGSNSVETWSFESQGQSPSALPLGTADAWHLRRLPRQANDQTLDLWFVPAWGHAPARIRIRHPNGDVVDQQLSGR